MGVVWKARQLDLDRVVALKLIQPDKSGDPEFLVRFRRESRLAASIAHPNVVPVFDAGEEGGIWYIAMRYVDGTDLGEYLRSRDSPLASSEAVSLISTGGRRSCSPSCWSTSIRHLPSGGREPGR